MTCSINKAPPSEQSFCLWLYQAPSVGDLLLDACPPVRGDVRGRFACCQPRRDRQQQENEQGRSSPTTGASATMTPSISSHSFRTTRLPFLAQSSSVRMEPLATMSVSFQPFNGTVNQRLTCKNGDVAASYMKRTRQ